MARGASSAMCSSSLGSRRPPSRVSTRRAGAGASSRSTVLSRWQQAKEGSGQVALISGEAGIGKSRLVQSLGERLHEERKATVSYACSPHYVHSALFPFIAQLERSAGFSPTDSSEARLSRLESLLRQTGAEPGDALALIADLL